MDATYLWVTTKGDLFSVTGRELRTAGTDGRKDSLQFWLLNDFIELFLKSESPR